ncbi:MFS transporter [Convivina intestini]|uniref:DHA1 family multidrug resistance protein-like MFS transporter n=1 Tax=Convivina intestini TaxID=1505726 RepID=A0A2U1DFK4_9LACO|nr:MFS transporter [Convivina intestini]PVY86457.1 DHA1 family multidrug resistance protein-like MFS transporter [Convivina intestini]CAH1850199.1 Staphyloferrin B transporter [Convivina intestini]SDB83845.1 MFS transporter, DHA1 family, multidrug resistance protein [Leuconostocaceae bacterium R-53105]
MDWLSKKEVWERNVIIVWFGVFMTGIGLSEIIPFLSLYVDTLGHFSKNELTLYSGAAFAITFLVTAIVSPLWGKLADQKGRKLMMLRAAAGMGVIFFLMGFTTNVWQLIVLRAIQGALGGFVSNANALIATQTPKSQVGRSLGIVVTGFTAGTLLGPIVGGALASAFSYQLTFHITGFIMFLVFFLILFLVQENQRPSQVNQQKPLEKITWATLPHKHLLVSLFITTMLVQAVNMSINPIVSLFVRELVHNSHNVTFLAGVVAAAPGLATIIAAPSFGRLGDRIGTRFLIQIGFVIAVLAFIPTAFVTSVTLLILLRFIVGISDATLLPAIQTLLSKNSPQNMISRIFSYNQSFQAIGSVAGPMLGAVIANLYDYRAIFLVSAGIMVINALLFSWNTRRQTAK